MSVVPYAELHCHSNLSFLDGASSPEELVEEATRLNLEALAITDHNGLYGVVRFAQAAQEVGLPTIFGAELSLDATTSRTNGLDPSGDHLVVLARNPLGYKHLAKVLTEAQLAGKKQAPKLNLATLGQATPSSGNWAVLTGCRKSPLNKALIADGPRAAKRTLDELVELFGHENIYVELWNHGDPLDETRNEALARLAVNAGVGLVATNNVHYATPKQHRLAKVMASIRAGKPIHEMDGWLPGGSGAHLRSGAEQSRWFSRFPGVIEQASELGQACAFDLKLLAPKLPPFPCPRGFNEDSYLRSLVSAGAERLYSKKNPEIVAKAQAQIEHELTVIETLGFAGYFLIVWDIVQECERLEIFCQGRGSAANSVVCYALGITKADPISLGLLFERFLSVERDGPPDIDIDIESHRREEVIQYVYTRYGRDKAALVANVISYRGKSAVREVAKALGYSKLEQDTWAKQIDRWTPDDKYGAPPLVKELVSELVDSPRHLGIHPGGMVICDRPVSEVCPVEWGTMAGRTVLQWDKDDCAAAGLVKFDLLGLGMLTALHLAVDLIKQHYDIEVDLALLPQDDRVYDMLCEADSVGVFQVESRAQMATLPRVQPREFYDLVVQVALIRPGPIQGGSVHPYIRRRNGHEKVSYLHPLLERSLAKTLGVPLFQEQLMQMAIDVAGFSPAQADQLRQAMGSKRSKKRMEQLREQLFQGMAARGITGEVAEAIYGKLAAFADFGFPESHSVSFAYLVYASAWLKRFYPAVFYTALINAQPMGFYSPHSLVQDARRHGVNTYGADLNRSQTQATLEGPFSNAAFRATTIEWGLGGPSIRLGLSSVKNLGDTKANQIVAEREENGLYTSIEDFIKRTETPKDLLESLAISGAFGDLAADRRSALWVSGALAGLSQSTLPGIVNVQEAPALPKMDAQETALADLWASGISPEGHPTRFLREALGEKGVVEAKGLKLIPNGAKVLVAGVVTHRQRPATAAGVTFVSLEDETGFVNVIVSQGAWQRYSHAARFANALLIKGQLERGEGGVVNIKAERLEALDLRTKVSMSRDFR